MDAQPAAEDPDALYADRETPASATRAVALWEARVAAAPADIEAGWKLARGRYWLGTNGPGTSDEKKRMLEAGMAAARHVITQAPARPEGHFWLAANMGALAEAHGLRQGIRYRGGIKSALETVLRLDPGYLDGSADRALGRWYFKVPGLFGGSNRRSEEHLRKALAYNPDSVITRLFLAETLVDLDRRDEARRELEAAIAAPLDPDWAPEDRVFKAQAAALLTRLSR
ncbi:MAG: TRAP transporter TatT component family protein [Vicinamibacterales bacterium]|nr:TRAP transporter TatT component family protein [Vicinamibacterales bacterium]